MTKYILFLSFLLTITISSAQVTNQGKPVSWDIEVEGLTPIQLPEFNLAELQQEDAINDERFDVPWRFGYEHVVSYGLDNAGVWKSLESGDRIWLASFKSNGAKTLNFIFDQFYIPVGGKLYFYNEDRTDLLGAYTHTQNTNEMIFGSWLVEGDHIFVEYFEPKNHIGEGDLNISQVVHGYRSVTENESIQKALNDSGACNLDVDCSIGEDFNDFKDFLKKSVALTVVGGNGFCTGTLINNTTNDGTQYFLTANHCLGGGVGNWAFRFNWVSPSPVCATFANSPNGSFNQTASGAILRASNSKSDMALIEIVPSLPQSWDLVWAGWDRTDTNPDLAVGIHHPSGDIMKVCRDNNGPTKVTTGFNGANANMWLIGNWEEGVTEPGSSGSAIFDQNGRIIGQLAGGSAACSGTNDNGGFDIYGRFATSWDFGNTNNTRLRNWLDPTNTGVTTLDAFPDQGLSTDNQFTFESHLQLYPNPASNEVFVNNLTANTVHYQVFNLNGKLLGKGKISAGEESINLSEYLSGMYFIKFVDDSNSYTSTKKLIIK